MKKIINLILLISIVIFTLNSCGKGSSYQRGKIAENGFESEYLNLKFVLPEGFVMGSEEDMLEIMNVGLESIEADKLAIEISKLATVYEMMAVAPSGFPSVSVIVERLIGNVSTEKYAEALKNILLSVDSINYIIGDQINTVEIAGQNYKNFSASVPDLGIIQSYSYRKQGNRMISFIVTYSPYTENEAKVLMDGFSKLSD